MRALGLRRYSCDGENAIFRPKMYFAMVSDAPAGFIRGVVPYHWTQVVNIKRDRS